jgi:hypothetical protein
MILINGVELTPAQVESLIKLVNIGWTLDYTSIHKLPAEQCIMVAVKGNQTGAQMVMGIEADGYTHS